MYRHDPYTVHVIRLSLNIDRKQLRNGCTSDKFLSPYPGAATWTRTMDLCVINTLL